MESESAGSTGGSYSVEIDDTVVFTTLFNAGLSPQEAEVWIGRELVGASTPELSYVFQLSELVATQAYRRAITKVNYLGITKESMLALKKESARRKRLEAQERWEF